MLIENTKPSIHGLGFYDSHGKIGTVKMVPGINEIDDAEWEKVKNLRTVKSRLENGTYVIRSASGESITKLAAADAVRQVKRTFDSKLLDKWIAEDQRKAVRDAIAEQYTKITPATSKG